MHVPYAIMHFKTVDLQNLLLVIAIKCNLRQFCKMGKCYNHYYKKFTKAIKLKCGCDFDYIIKYVWCKKKLAIAITS